MIFYQNPRGRQGVDRRNFIKITKISLFVLKITKNKNHQPINIIKISIFNDIY